MSLSFFLLMALLLLFLIKPMRFFIRFYRRKKRLSKYVSHLPSPKGYPLVGSGCMFLGKSTQRRWIETVNSYIANLRKNEYTQIGLGLISS